MLGIVRHLFAPGTLLIFDSLRVLCIGGCFLVLALASNLIIGHFKYGERFINRSTLYTAMMFVVSMIYIMFTEIGQVGLPLDPWRIWVGLLSVGLAITSSFMRYREIHGWNKTEKEKRSKKSSEEETLERLKNETAELLTSQAPELSTPRLAPEEDDQGRHS